MTGQLHLYITLLALLPKDGSSIDTASLAKVTGATLREVAESLNDAVRAGHVRHDLVANTYSAVKRGGAL